MKEKIVIEGKEPKEVIKKLVKTSGLQMFEDLQNKNKISICGEELRVEQVPETWEELEELCKDIKGVKVFGGCISIGEDSHETYFLKDGTIGKENGADVWWNTDIAQNRTPQQMWQIIKNLIGENNDTTKET